MINELKRYITMQVPYIDIHTHHSCRDGVICIRNLNHNTPPLALISKNTIWSAGIHPWDTSDSDIAEKNFDILRQLISDKAIAAIGEAGLDKSMDTPFVNQLEIFEKQIELSESFKLPMIIHCVKAYDELLRMRKQLKAQQVWIIHGFNSSLQMALQLSESDCMLSFGRMLFRLGSKAALVLPDVKADRFFLETDDDTILKIEDLYSKAAELISLSMEELKKVQFQNWQRIFPKQIFQ